MGTCEMNPIKCYPFNFPDVLAAPVRDDENRLLLTELFSRNKVRAKLHNVIVVLELVNIFTNFKN